MTEKKKGNAFTDNPLVRAIGVQKIVVVLPEAWIFPSEQECSAMRWWAAI